ncbi:unnamed protein product [Candidula unifasciata]|uniref:Mediator of RNA polymerase II transcription subunit 1 n=1 Tax=Candidula unifasciata TaxID=100452 RepID=A0A8S3YYW1_9EUPU|nr:unnamed protein product [Candidula unifasciata]
MAAQTGGACVCLDHQLSHGGATKKTLGALIERLRNSKSQNHSWNESIKYVWSSVAERRAQIENTEPSGVQQCLDTLQKVITVKSQQNLKEKLDVIGRRLGLNTQIQEQKVSLRTDAFQVDVLLGDGGLITNVRLANQGDVMECPNLKEILQKGDFSEFIEHLQGLQSIYQVTTDEKLKSKAFVALQALEKDLNQLAQFQSSISGVANYIHKCPLGIMLPRLAGKPMKLIYFVSPYDLLDKKSLAAHPLTVEAITENLLGQSVNVCIEPVPESAPANKLQTMPLMNVSKTQDGKSLPSFSAVSKINSMMLPASFVLVLAQGVPVSAQILQKITSLTCLEIHKEAECRSLRSLILETFSGGDIREERRLVVSLPDQQHIYFLECLNGGCQEHQGLMVSRIPFTHPTHVPQILNLLRQQLLFNIVVGSCVRPGAKSESSNSVVFEVTAISLQQLTIVFEHPAYDSMIRVDIDLADITNLKCKVACTNSDQVLCSDEAISRVFHRCMSIPIMLRWLIGKGLGQLDKLKEAALAAEREQKEKEQFLKELKQQQAKFQPTTVQTNRPPPQPPHPPPLPPPPSYPQFHSPVHIPHNVMNSIGQLPALTEAGAVLADFSHMTDGNSKHLNDRLPLVADSEQVRHSVVIPLLLEEELASASKPKEVHDAPMLSRLLDDNTSVATTVIPMDCKPALMTSVKRSRKRKPQSDSSGPSPKHYLADGDFSERFGPLGASLDLDMMPGVIDHHFHNSPPVIRSMTPTYGSSSHHAHHPVLNRAPARSQNNVIDLTEDTSVGESSLKRLSDLSMLFNETEAQSRIPNLLQNSPSNSKNENASTSLEGYLTGSGEVGRAQDFDPSDASSVHSSSTVSRLTCMLSENTSPCLSTSPPKANSALLTGKAASGDLCSVGLRKSPSNTIGQDVRPPQAGGGVCQGSDLNIINDRKSMTGLFDQINDRKSMTGLFDRFDISKQQKAEKAEAVSGEVRSQLVEGKVCLRLKVGPLKQQNSIKPLVKSYRSLDEAVMCGQKNNLATFDFKSDEDDEAPLVHFSSDRYVYSSSPTCLQISSKQKPFADHASIHHKSDRVKRKDKNSGNTTKRKREKDKSKREKKKKKSEHFIQESVYRTVENDAKGDFKMKIRVKPVTDKSDLFSDGKVASYEISKKPLVSSVVKPPASHEHVRGVHIVNEIAKEKESTGESDSHKAVSGKSAVLLHKPFPKMGSCRVSPSAGAGIKTDPKLVTKATIRLKPLTMPNCSSSVNISKSSLAHKAERCNSACVIPPVLEKPIAVHNSLERRGSTSNLIDRRSLTQSSSSTPLSASTTSTSTTPTPSTTTTTANLSLSSILPNAPTVSKIASLPRIPKLSSSSSNASISRTSSLDTVSELTPTSAGTKANNSYTLGPAGKLSAGSAATLNYGSRPMASGNGSSATGWSTFNTNRPGLGHRQTSPLVISNQAGLQRTALGHKAGFRSAGNHKHLSSFTNNRSIKELAGSSSSTQKTFSNVFKPSSRISSPLLAGHFMGHKPNAASVHPQKHASPNTHVAASSRTGSGTLDRSPNTSGVTRSPNSGRSPSINSSGRSPSINNSGRSPSINNSGRSPNINNSGRSPNINNSGRSPSINNSGRSPNINNSGRSPNINNSGRSPNINNSGRSPSINNSGRSPNINNSGRSPNISNSSLKCTASPSTGRPTLSHRQIPGVSTFSSVHKSILKTHDSSTSHRTGSLKSSPSETGTNSNSPHTADSAPIVAAAYPLTNFPGEGCSMSSLPSNGAPSPSVHKLSAAQPHTISVFSFASSVSTSSPPTSPSLLNSSTVADSVWGRHSQASVDTSQLLPSDKLSSSPGVVIPHGADSTRNRFHSCSTRGRKSSLSAIVDKLKHSAVGSSVASVRPVRPCSESLYSQVSQPLWPGQDGVHSTITHMERTLSSQPVVNVQSGVEIRPISHISEGNQKAVVCAEQEKDAAAGTCLTAPDAVRDSDTLSSEICDRGQNVENKTGHVPMGMEAKHQLGLVMADGSTKGESPGTRLDGSVLKNLSGPPQTSASSHQNSLTASAHLRPASPFHPLEPSGAASRNFSPLTVPTGRDSSQGLSLVSSKHPETVPSGRDSSQGLSLVSPKHPEECLYEDSQTDKILMEPRGNGRLGDHDTEQHNDTACIGVEMNSSKPLSSPLSDISSAGSDLVIDDEAATHTVPQHPCQFSGSNSLHKPQSLISSSSQSLANNLDHATSCPGTTSPPPPSAKCASLAKYPQCASSRESDSPCPIDDDLMDMALGLGS